MLGLGQLSTVITQVNGVLANKYGMLFIVHIFGASYVLLSSALSLSLYLWAFRQQWKSELNTYRVEAAWKLGKWDLLEDYLSSGSNQTQQF